jgi:hypothetical protein
MVSKLPSTFLNRVQGKLRTTFAAYSIFLSFVKIAGQRQRSAAWSALPVAIRRAIMALIVSVD